MKFIVDSKAGFRSQLLEAGVPASKVDAAIAYAEKDRGPLRAGLKVQIPDSFRKKSAGDKVRKTTVGDVDSPARAPAATGGRRMGALSMHAFNDVQNTGRRVDACGSSEIMIGGEFHGIDACGGSAPVRSRKPAASACGTADTTEVKRPRRRAPATAVSCGSVVVTRRNYGGAC